MSCDRYPQDYRHHELRLVSNNALQGQSMGFVGIAGTGKSNLVRYLRDGMHLEQYLLDKTDQVHFAEANTIDWEGSPEHLWYIMLRGLNEVMKRVGVETQESVSQADSPDAATLHSELKGRIDRICQRMGHQLMFILDDFDEVIAQGPRSMLERLSKLRTEGNVERLSYLVVTKKLPHVLGQAHSFQISQFYRLIRDELYALGMYKETDASQMLAHLNCVGGEHIPAQHLRTIRVLAGGHAGLIKTVFNSWPNEGALESHPVSYFSATPSVREECFRILIGLHDQEQQVARRLARGEDTVEDVDTIDHLVRRGILTKARPVTEWFSPLMPLVLQSAQL
jgi:hypothetical protein